MQNSSTQLADPGYLLNELDRIIGEEAAKDQNKTDFFKALKRFIALDQDNPFVHRFLYEFERSLIRFAQMDMSAQINVDAFEDDEGKNLFHHIGINVNMLFEEVKERVYPKEHVYNIIDIIDQPGIIIDTHGFVEHCNDSFANMVDQSPSELRHQKLDRYVTNLGSCMYKAALISGDLELDDIKLSGPNRPEQVFKGKVRAMGNEFDPQMNFAIILSH